MRTPPQALIFDVFGTCVDWRTSIRDAGEALAQDLAFPLGAVDWSAFADAWRARYQPQLETVRDGRRPWLPLDQLHRESLDALLPAFGLTALDETSRTRLNRAWHRLAPWPDVVPGLTRLKRDFIIAPNSNGNIALMVNLAKHAGLPWDAILGAEITRAYKPQPAAYLGCVTALGLMPGSVMMVAAHHGDLIAAAGCGLQTAFVPRPEEHGPRHHADRVDHAERAVAQSYTVVAADFGDLADLLGA